ncbi:hypothetical protein V6N11_080547 [Hibiscus sabdariffa]|uniref:Uncharacterized protein n=1 Tax=Hibiscus sabdariffa TaxID=183260 RepID=A0ABR2R817_9ROSI
MDTFGTPSVVVRPPSLVSGSLGKLLAMSPHKSSRLVIGRGRGCTTTANIDPLPPADQAQDHDDIHDAEGNNPPEGQT